ncbi:DUF4190 domain-containing protein [Leifsonia sp. AG29]|uniref:DUF4190 domain-containing protein n=1 Tax=Leifsonia sp. AG29 TaxID=2598860 RepID=UPI00131B7697|nr:DUF4190 domain-containing protein [Leifsonia sp. AG29]
MTNPPPIMPIVAPAVVSPASAADAPRETPTDALAAPTARYNVLSLIGVVVVSMNPILGVVLAHIGFGQLRRTGERGRGLAITTLILGYGLLALTVVWAAVTVAIVIADPAAFGFAFDPASGDGTSHGFDPNDYSDSDSRTGGYSSDDYDY